MFRRSVDHGDASIMHCHTSQQGDTPGAPQSASHVFTRPWGQRPTTSYLVMGRLTIELRRARIPRQFTDAPN